MPQPNANITTVSPKDANRLKVSPEDIKHMGQIFVYFHQKLDSRPEQKAWEEAIQAGLGGRFTPDGDLNITYMTWQVMPTLSRAQAMLYVIGSHVDRWCDQQPCQTADIQQFRDDAHRLCNAVEQRFTQQCSHAGGQGCTR